MDSVKNFAKVTLVAGGYAAGELSIDTLAGQGTRLPAAPFNATWWNASDYPDPSDDPYREIVRVTVIAVDTLTITRGQESTSNTNHNIAGKTYQLMAGVTAKTIADLLSGSVGASGYTGYTGRTGYTGYTGPSVTGYTGPRGVTGYSGYSGYTGRTGYTGYTGLGAFTGYTGASGYTGPTGYTGYTGFTGYSGPTGYTGAAGTPGGPTGYTGYFGNSGYTGYTGYTGDAGAASATGATGYTGYTGPQITGYTGYTGNSGYTGYTGYSGYSGYTGTTGYTGYSGYTGYRGYSGYTGYTGYTGAGNFTGPSGYTGYTGPKITGYSGYTGYSGRTGYTGYTGPQITGYTGYTGVGPNWAWDETPSGAMNGINLVFTLAHSVGPAGSLSLYLNGIRQLQVTDYAIVGNTITYVSAPVATDWHRATYAYDLPASAGWTGYSGPTGYSGYSGYTGRTGYTGYTAGTGYTGYTGPQITGYTGYTGPGAFTGYTGYSGYTGPQITGYTGYTGSGNFTGYTGYSGAGGTGYTGYSGSGATGYTGYTAGTGYSGYSGYTGYTGTAGAATATGATGYTGYTGPQITGYTGYTGAGNFTGYTGYTGSGGVAGPGGVSGLARWFSADAITGLNDGDPVPSWRDAVSGYAASAIGTVPTLQTNELNSLPIVRFGGAGYYRFTGPFDEGEFSFFLVLKITSLVNAYSGILGQHWTADSGGYFIKSSGKTALYLPANVYDGTGSATLNNTTFYVLSGIVGPTAVATQAALAADGSNASFSPNQGTHNVLLGNQPAAGRVFTGDIAEVLIYGRALSDADRDTIEAYLKNKYGL